MIYSKLFLVAAAFTGFASAVTNFTACCDVDPTTVDSPTRAAWCRAQMNTCPELCPNGNAAVNKCDNVSICLSYHTTQRLRGRPIANYYLSRRRSRTNVPAVAATLRTSPTICRLYLRSSATNGRPSARLPIPTTSPAKPSARATSAAPRTAA
jgi:hypothetical protein